ncbi:zinc-dependent alcohol dehydrogenase [Paenibacillus daejeonensis]|uniref:zinc-dependent alcohol dehydrogenase n=1 Tax=Paenibacillus daejeonensis TaxID=135193 RepID=UPI00037F1960|nr:alcohol dehydrogenase catalytic domain-containing protein [Paenibacillus daejeonensis]
MKALQWMPDARLVLRELDEPGLVSSTAVKIRIEMTGICGTDLAVIAGKEEGVAHITRGHEAVGVIVETGASVRELAVGDRVVIDPNYSCGGCEYCLRLLPHLCIGSSGTMAIAGLNVNGTFAGYYVSEARYVHRLPQDMPWERGVLVEPLACVLHNLQEARVASDDSVLVLGSGPMGLLCQMASRRLARLTVATELNPYRLEAAGRIADEAYHPAELDEQVIARLTGGRGFDVVIDAVGNQLEMADRVIGRGGRIVPLGIHGSYRYTIAPARLIQRAISIIGAGEYRCMFPLALRMAHEMTGLDRLVTKRYSLEQHEQAMEELLGYNPATGEPVQTFTLKSVFEPWGCSLAAHTTKGKMQERQAVEKRPERHGIESGKAKRSPLSPDFTP